MSSIIPEGTECFAIRDYVPATFDELELHAGDLVVIEPLNDSDISRIPQGYLKGVNRHLGPNNGRVGYFPADAVDFGGSQPPSSMGSNMSISQERQMMSTHSLKMDQDDYIKELEKNVKIGSSVLVRYPYQATKADELDLNINDVLVITACPPGGWWKGAYYTNSGLGKVGWFPCNFVEITTLPSKPLSAKSQTTVKRGSLGKKEENTSDSESNSSKGISRFWKKSKKSPSVSDINSPQTDHDASFSQTQIDQPLTLGSEEYATSSLNSSCSESALKKEKTFSSQSVEGSSVLASITRRLSNSALYAPVETKLIVKELPILNKPKKKSWKDGMSDEALQALSQTETKKQQVIWEWYVTESAYLRDLKMVVEVFQRPLVEQKIVAQKHVELIFGNIESILWTNYEFYRGLERLYDLDPIVEDFGKFMIPICETFLIYTAYCANTNKALAKVKELTNSNKAFKQFLTEAYQNEATRHLDLGSYLLKPMQRICKYPLLLMEIGKNTPDNHPDKYHMDIAICKLQSVVMSVNEGVDGQQKIVEIQQSLSEKMQLMSPTRYFVREDQISVLLPPPDSRTKPRVLFLFNDLLLLCKKDWREKNHVIDKSNLENVEIADLNSSECLLELKFKQHDSVYLLVFSTKAQKDAWVTAWKSLTRIVSISMQSISPETKKRSLIDASSVQNLNQPSQELALPIPPQVKPNSSQYDLSGNLKRVRSRLSVHSFESNSRPRANSVNESVNYREQISKELNGPLVIPKAQSVADLQSYASIDDTSSQYHVVTMENEDQASVRIIDSEGPSRPMSVVSFNQGLDVQDYHFRMEMNQQMTAIQQQLEKRTKENTLLLDEIDKIKSDYSMNEFMLKDEINHLKQELKQSIQRASDEKRLLEDSNKALESRQKNLETEISKLTEKVLLSEANDKTEFFETKLGDLRLDLEKKEEKIIALERSNKSLTEARSSLEEENKVLCEEKKSVVGEIKMVRLDLEKKEQKINALESSNKSLTEAKSSLEDKIKMLNYEKDLLEEEVNEMRLESESKTSQIKSLKDSLEEQNKIQIIEKEEMKKLLEKNKALTLTVSETQEQMKRKILEKEKALNESTKIIRKLEAELNEKMETIASLKDQIGNYESSNRELLDVHDQLKSEIARLNNLISMSQTTGSESAKIIRKLESEVNQKTQTINFLNSQISLKNKEIADLAKSQYETHEEKERLESELEALLLDKERNEKDFKMQNEKLSQKLMAIQGDLTKNERLSKEQIHLLKRELESIKNALSQAETKLREAQDLGETLQNEIQEKSNEIKRRESETQILQTKLIEISSKKPVAPTKHFNMPMDEKLLQRIADLEQENLMLKSTTIRKDSMAVEINRLNHKLTGLSRELDNERSSLQEIRSSHQNIALSKVVDVSVQTNVPSKSDSSVQTLKHTLTENFTQTQKREFVEISAQTSKSETSEKGVQIQCTPESREIFTQTTHIVCQISTQTDRIGQSETFTQTELNRINSSSRSVQTDSKNTSASKETQTDKTDEVEKRTVTDLISHYENLGVQVDQMKQKADCQIRMLQNEKQNLEMAIEHLETNNSRVTKDLYETRAKNKRMEAEIQSAVEEKYSLVEEKEKVSKQLEKSVEYLKQVREMLKQEQEKSSNLQQQLDEVNDSLKKIKQGHLREVKTLHSRLNEEIKSTFEVGDETDLIKTIRDVIKEYKSLKDDTRKLFESHVKLQNEKQNNLVPSNVVEIKEYQEACEEIQKLHNRLRVTRQELNECAIKLATCQSKQSELYQKIRDQESKLKQGEAERLRLVEVIDEYKISMSRMETIYQESIRNRENDFRQILK